MKNRPVFVIGFVDEFNISEELEIKLVFKKSAVRVNFVIFIV